MQQGVRGLQQGMTTKGVCESKLCKACNRVCNSKCSECEAGSKVTMSEACEGCKDCNKSVGDLHLGKCGCYGKMFLQCRNLTGCEAFTDPAAECATDSEACRAV